MTTTLSRSRVAAAITVLVSCAACGGSSSSEPNSPMTFDEACALVPGCDQPRRDISGPKEVIWRVEVLRSGSGDVTLGRVEALEVTEGAGVPVSPLAGSHLLVARDAAGDSLDSQLVRFFDVLEMESLGEVPYFAKMDLAGREVSALGFLRALPGVQEIAIVDTAGATLDSVPAPAAKTKARAGAVTSHLAQASPGCAHVALLEGQADRAWAPHLPLEGDTNDLGETIEARIVVPGPTQRAVVAGALAMMPPLLCHGIGRIALGEMPARPDLKGAVWVFHSGDLIFVNVQGDYAEDQLAVSEEKRVRMMRTLVHEAGHASEALLSAEGSVPGNFAGGWVPEARTLANDTIDRVRLEKGLHREWQRMHDSFASLGWANAYPQTLTQILETAADIANWTPSQVAEAGAMSRYGATNRADDIADMVAWPLMGPLFRAAGIPEGARDKEDFACQQMRAYTERNVPSRLSAVFTKLSFLRELGLVWPEDAENCMGPDIGIQTTTPGMHFWQDDSLLRSFTTGVTAAIGTDQSGTRVFVMDAEGQAEFSDVTYPASAQLSLALEPGSVRIEQVSWPRGVYSIAPGTGNEFLLRLEGAASGNFDVIDGFALVVESSNDRIAGSVFIRIAFRLSAPIPVPQTFDPPLVVRFLIEN